MENPRRYHWIVSLRAFAALAIVLLHTISGWTAAGGGNYSQYSMVLG